MPRSAPMPCNEPGCARMRHPDYQQWCQVHGPRKLEEQARRRTRRGRRVGLDKKETKLLSFYSTKRWQKTRNAYFSRNPLCVRCAAEGVTKAGHVVDHIVERRDGGADYDHSNLQTLCQACHNRKTKEAARRRLGDREGWKF